MRRRNEAIGLDAVFFERMVEDANFLIDKMVSDGIDLNDSYRQLAYLEGRISVVFQIYASRVYNPRLLEKSEAALTKIRSILSGNVKPNPDKMKKSELIELCDKIGIDHNGMGIREMRNAIKKQQKEKLNA